MTIRGSCFCGEIKYAIDGELRNAASCHCSQCRKMFSSQASSYAIVNSEEFTWLMNENLLSTYEADKDLQIKFCKKCGSTLGGTYKGELSWVTLGCIEGDPQIGLSQHIFVGSKANWETIPEGVPQYEAWPPKEE